MRNIKQELTVSGENALQIADAINATTLKILKILGQERLDVTTISKRLDLSEAYTSEQIRVLEDLNLISISYERGKRGIRKVSQTSLQKIIIALRE